jgi:agmatine deiminase
MKSFKFRVFNFCILLLTVIVSSCSKSSDGPFYYPADFDPAESTSFIWTTDFYEIIPELAGTISKKDKVTLFISEKENTKNVQSLIEKFGGNVENISFIKLNNKPQNAWIRDFGPVYVINSSGNKQLVNFLYYGKRQTFNEQIAEKFKLNIVHSPISSTGGSREVNGKGTIILCEAHELAENKPKSRQEIEEEMLKSLNLKKVIWLKQGIPQDDNPKNGPLTDKVWPNGVNGHVDEFVRFADANTVLISSVSEAEAGTHPILAEAKRRLDENYEILLNSTDQDGNKLNVIKVPFAPLVIDRDPQDNRRLQASVTSYMNFIVTNSLIILPSYTSLFTGIQGEDYQARENEVVQIFKEAFPSREIIRVQAASLNRFSGGFHCVSINVPLAE